MDFDDLLLQTNILFRDHPEVLKKYSDHFRFILVDEYQDTNFAQHLIVKKLCQTHNRLCVVGDDAQSIYSFRGAKIDNILQFRSQFDGCRIFKLEQNYRSTQNIVNAANSLIFKNSRQIQKNVFSEKEVGSKLYLFSTYSDYEEAYAVAARIESMKHTGNAYSDFAVLYRTNAQSRVLEEALRKRSIPYKIYGGLSFYQRKEVKDIISYLRLIINPNDEEALKRVINYPTRGIGDTTLKKVVACAMDNRVSLWNVISNPEVNGLSVNKGTMSKLLGFKTLIDGFTEMNKTMNASEIAAHVAKESGIIATLYADSTAEGVSQQENIQELLKGIAEFCEFRSEEGSENVSLADFLSEVSLLTDQDNDKDEFANKVTLMTVHAAKGLEFPHVFVVGMEEDLFPSSMSKDNPMGVEEERRLFYVAITRAEKSCTLSFAKSRFRNGQSCLCSPSRFLRDIDKAYLNVSDDVNIPGSGNRTASPSFGGFERREQTRTEKSTPARELIAPGLKPVGSYRKVEQSASASSATYDGDLIAGMRVSHDRFGIGIIEAISGEGANAKAIVNFENVGQKQLLLKFAKLTVL
jgi:DNA helicase-2/ATP-dependent DNA helicase PcrA